MWRNQINNFCVVDILNQFKIYSLGLIEDGRGNPREIFLRNALILLAQRLPCVTLSDTYPSLSDEFLSSKAAKLGHKGLLLVRRVDSMIIIDIL